jgi:hypothetical protein
MLTCNFSSVNIPIGTTDISPIISVPTNGYISLIPNSQNVYIKKIYINLVHNQINEVLNFYSIRFRLRNRDISLNTNLAGNILNPVSGPWNGSLPKDSICDIMLSNKKNFIEFKEPILAGGIQFQTLRLIFNQPTVSITNVIFAINMQYDEQ